MVAVIVVFDYSWLQIRNCMLELPSIENLSIGIDIPLRRLIKQGLFGISREFKTAKVRRELLVKNNICSICNTLMNDSKETHVDHMWTKNEATNAVFDGSLDLISAFNRLQAPENLRVVHASCNWGRNKK